MATTIKMDRAGRMVLPKPLREKFGLRGEAKLRVEMVGDHLELTPETPEEFPPLVRKNGLLIVSATGILCDAVEALQAEREDREDSLAGKPANPNR